MRPCRSLLFNPAFQIRQDDILPLQYQNLYALVAGVYHAPVPFFTVQPSFPYPAG
jgi:hypothetical protein